MKITKSKIIGKQYDKDKQEYSYILKKERVYKDIFTLLSTENITGNQKGEFYKHLDRKSYRHLQIKKGRIYESVQKKKSFKGYVYEYTK